MSDLAPIAPKLSRLVRMLASDSDGEALGAARALKRVLSSAGASFNDLAERIERPASPTIVFRHTPDPEPERQPRWEFMSDLMRKNWLLKAAFAKDVLDDWQISFAIAVSKQTRDGGLTDRHVASINSIFARLWVRGVRI